MNTDAQQQDGIDPNSVFLNWQNGGIELSRIDASVYHKGSSLRNPGQPQEEYPLDSSRAFAQLELIFDFAINGLQGIRTMIPNVRSILDAFSEAPTQQLRTYWAKQLDVVLDQLAQMAEASEIEGVNLLHNKNSLLELPYFVTEIRADGGEYHNFTTVGISISPVRETMKNGTEHFAGLFILSTSETGSVFWLSSLNTWMENQDRSDWEEAELEEEVNLLRERLNGMNTMLSRMEAQCHEYMEMVGEIITDHSVNQK